MKNFINFTIFDNSTKIAAISFIIGTLLLIAHLIFKSAFIILLIGLFYVYLAVFINLIVLLFLIISLITNPKNRKSTIIKILIVLLNVPIAVAYFLIILNENSLFNQPF